MIEMDLRTFLLEQTAITTLIGARIYPVALPQSATKPALTYQRISGGEDVTHRGLGPAMALIQIGCWSERYEGALALAQTVRAALSGHRGAMGSSRYVTAMIVNVIDLPEPTIDLSCRALDVAINYEA